MKVIGFNFTKIHAEKNTPNIKDAAIDNNVQFTDLEEDTLDLLKDEKVLKTSFKYSLIYSEKEGEKKENTKNHGEVSFEGNILLSVDKKEAKEFLKAWKNKQVPETAVIPLYNIIFRRCGSKSIPLQEDLSLPSPFLKVPQASPKK
jgi:hypothetical protein